MNREQLEEIRARAEKAVEGPWRVVEHDIPDTGDASSVLWVQAESGHRPEFAWLHPDEATEHDAEFIAHARTDVPALLDEIDRLNADASKVNVASLRELAGALNRMEARHPHANYIGFGDAILRAIGEQPGYLGATTAEGIAEGDQSKGVVS